MLVKGFLKGNGEFVRGVCLLATGKFRRTGLEMKWCGAVRWGGGLPVGSMNGQNLFQYA